MRVMFLLVVKENLNVVDLGKLLTNMTLVRSIVSRLIAMVLEVLLLLNVISYGLILLFVNVLNVVRSNLLVVVVELEVERLRMMVRRLLCLMVLNLLMRMILMFEIRRRLMRLMFMVLYLRLLVLGKVILVILVFLSKRRMVFIRICILRNLNRCRIRVRVIDRRFMIRVLILNLIVMFNHVVILKFNIRYLLLL